MMCLLSLQTSQTLVSLSTDCMLLISSGSVFCKSKLFKTSCPKSQQQSIEFKTYPHNVSLCIVALVKLYLDKAAAPRNDVNSKFLLAMLFHTNQCQQEHRQGGYQIFSARQILIPRIFKTHHLHSASTSNAFSGGLFLTEIAKAARWTNVEKFGKHYNKPVIENNFDNFY